MLFGGWDSKSARKLTSNTAVTSADDQSGGIPHVTLFGKRENFLPKAVLSSELAPDDRYYGTLNPTAHT
jgi:hypothetical protein